MPITVAVISQQTDRRQHVVRSINEVQDLLVVHQAEEAGSLRHLSIFPQVVLIGVSRLPRANSSDRLWKTLSRILRDAPTTRLAVWFETADDGATADLRSHGITGIVQWSDVKGNLWPQLTRTVSSGSEYWSRPFDTLDRRRPTSPGSAV